MSTFYDKCAAQWGQGKFVCVGLDTDYDRLPPHLKGSEESSESEKAAAMLLFNRQVTDTTCDVAMGYKLNSAFYEDHGGAGLQALKGTVDYIRRVAPKALVIDDAKRGDIDNTNNGYVRSIFDWIGADAVTVHPYLGGQALKPFLDRADKGVVVLCHTSNEGADEFQDYDISGDAVPGGYMPLYQYVAHRVSSVWNKNRNCALVVGATYPAQLREVRELIGDMPLLIPGIGAQGGDLEATVKAGRDHDGNGMVVNGSRSIIFASKGKDFAEAARRETLQMSELINRYRSES